MFALASLSFSPNAPLSTARSGSQTPAISANAQSRRELLSQVAAGFATATPLAASAKAGQFGKVEIFGVSGSSPYQDLDKEYGGTKVGALVEGKSTYGFKPTGDILSKGYTQDVTRELAAFKESSKRVSSLQPQIDSKTWWLARDNMRTQAYNMRSSMLAINNVLPADKKLVAEKAYKKFWVQVEKFDLALKKKEPELANKEYVEMLNILKAYTEAAV
jgi:hypothetical protein